MSTNTLTRAVVLDAALREFTSYAAVCTAAVVTGRRAYGLHEAKMDLLVELLRSEEVRLKGADDVPPGWMADLAGVDTDDDLQVCDSCDRTFPADEVGSARDNVAGVVSCAACVRETRP